MQRLLKLLLLPNGRKEFHTIARKIAEN